VARLENNSEYRYRVSEPMRAFVDGHPVWFYVKERALDGSVGDDRDPVRKPRQHDHAHGPRPRSPLAHPPAAGRLLTTRSLAQLRVGADATSMITMVMAGQRVAQHGR
jgi:hypothetical protein